MKAFLLKFLQVCTFVSFCICNVSLPADVSVRQYLTPGFFQFFNDYFFNGLEEISKKAISSAKIPDITLDKFSFLAFAFSDSDIISIENLTLNEFSFSPNSSVILLNDFLSINMKFNLDMSIYYNSTSKIIGISENGNLTVQDGSINILTKFSYHESNNTIFPTMDQVDAQFDNLELSLSNDMVDYAADVFSGKLKDMIENGLEGAIKRKIPEMVEQYSKFNIAIPGAQTYHSEFVESPIIVSEGLLFDLEIKEGSAPSKQMENQNKNASPIKKRDASLAVNDPKIHLVTQFSPKFLTDINPILQQSIVSTLVDLNFSHVIERRIWPMKISLGILGASFKKEDIILGEFKLGFENGGIHIDLSMSSLKGSMNLVSTVPGIPNGPTSFEILNLRAITNVVLESNDHELVPNIKDLNLSIGDLNIDTKSQVFDFFFNEISDIFRGKIASIINSKILEKISQVIGNAIPNDINIPDFGNFSLGFVSNPEVDVNGLTLQMTVFEQ